MATAPSHTIPVGGDPEENLHCSVFSEFLLLRNELSVLSCLHLMEFALDTAMQVVCRQAVELGLNSNLP